jgi:flagellar hook protein FlgE
MNKRQIRRSEYMLYSMFSAVSGLRAHQRKMDIIGNNIANVNTVGFKGARATFGEVFSKTIESATGADAETGSGGKNPMQVGLGIAVNSIDVSFTAGSVQRTDNPTDLMIDGEGFFVVKGVETDPYKFTRAGNFTIDTQGNLVTSGGEKVYGWQNKDQYDNFITEEDIEPINIFSDSHNGDKTIMASQATTSAVFSGNLDATYSEIAGTLSGTTNTLATIETALSGEDTFSIPYVVYDGLGNETTITIKFAKNLVTTPTPPATPTTQWFWYVESGATPPPQGYLTFNSDGKIDSSMTATEITPTLTVIPDGSTGAAQFDVTMDFSGIVQYSSSSSAQATEIDGYEPGQFVSFSIDSDGLITAVYSNGKQQKLGLLGLAVFENPAGLLKEGNNLFLESNNSGKFVKAETAGNGSAGALITGALEMSNVDLSSEFTEMITTQRGFQANSRIITVADEMLQELTSLKR